MNMPTEIVTALLAAQKIDRRGFLTFAAKGLALAFVLPVAGRIDEAHAAAPTDLNAFVHIGTDGSITLSFGGAEMGQGSMSGLPQILAEELMVDWTQIIVEQALVVPGVSYPTGGSSAVSRRYSTLRNAGAAARELLIKAAMAVTGDGNRDHYRAERAQVIHTAATPNVAWPYGALATAAASQTVPADLRLTNPANFRLIGKPVPRVDIPSKVDGSAKYGIDIWFPDMVFAAIKHCPTIGGTLASLPAKPAAALALVPCTASDTRGNVIAGSTNAVAVVATNTWLAFKLASSLSVSWKLPSSTGDVDSTQILALAKSMMATGAALLAEPAPPATTPPTPPYPAAPYEASVNADLGPTPTVNATYTLPYLAHATMEVLNCTVRMKYSGTGVATGCEIWAPTQAAATVALNAAKLTLLPASAITVHTTFLGGGLGRKIEQDYICQAIQVAMAVKKPVKLTWRREEDFAHDQYRPLALANVRATLSGGMIRAWSYRTVSQSISAQRGRLAAGFVDGQAVEGAVRLHYALGNHIVEWVPLAAGVPVGYWRSVGASINAFAVESMMDELARAAGKDPFQFRYDHLASNPDQRAYKVLWAADLMSSPWRKTLPAGHAWGVAIAESFGTIVCEVVDVSQPAAGSLRVHRVACVVDCGTVINPDSVEAQMQGGILHALNATLWGQTTFTAGKANQLNFKNYRVMRQNEMPQVTVQIIASANPPSGIGEPGVPPLAPALANAYARLTGTRIRTLPFFPGAVMGGI
jgi:isoquinoline 1-oxidoreductase beta subunit